MTTPTRKPWHVLIHTANGWIEHGTYATYRGANQAMRNAYKNQLHMPLADRVGGSGMAYAASYNENSDTVRDFERWLCLE